MRDDLELPDPTAELPPVAVNDDLIDVGVDVLPVRDRVLDALRAHVTQVQAVRAIDDDPALVACYALSNRVARARAAHRVLPTRTRGFGRRRRLARRCPPGSLTRVHSISAGVIGKAALMLGLGLLVGTLGTVMHRSVQPWGLLLCLALAFSRP